MNIESHPSTSRTLSGTLRRLGHVTLLLGLRLVIPDAGCDAAQPHHFDRIAVAPDQTVTMSLDGNVANLIPGLSGTLQSLLNQMFDLYLVEASTNLTDWTRLATLPRTNNNPGPLSYQDTEAPNHAHRFYRTLTNHLITSFPKPTGPFTVGTLDRVMVDLNRTNFYRYSPATNAFMVTYWYPAEPPREADLPGPRWNKRLAADASFYSLAGGDTGWTKLAPELLGHRYMNAPLATSQARYPILMFSHCLPTHRSFSSHIAEELASHGYIVIAPDHPDCYKTEFPDGRYLSGNWNGDNAGRFKDFQCLLDQLGQMNTSDPFFAGRLDLDRIGIYGLIYGGMVAEMCRRDDRVKCVALLEAENLQVPVTGLQKPFLAMNHSGSPRLAQNEALFNQATHDAVWLQVSGADRFTFTDGAWGAEIPWGRQPALAIDACLVWFFDHYLKGEEPPFPTHQALVNVKRK
jgi:hypothetical protein